MVGLYFYSDDERYVFPKGFYDLCWYVLDD